MEVPRRQTAQLRGAIARRVSSVTARAGSTRALLLPFLFCVHLMDVLYPMPVPADYAPTVLTFQVSPAQGPRTISRRLEERGSNSYFVFGSELLCNSLSELGGSSWKFGASRLAVELDSCVRIEWSKRGVGADVAVAIPCSGLKGMP